MRSRKMSSASRLLVFVTDGRCISLSGVEQAAHTPARRVLRGRNTAPFSCPLHTQGFALMSHNNRDAGKPERSTVIINNNNNNDDLSGQTLKSPLIGPH